MSIRPDEPTFISMMQTHQSAVYNLCYRMLGESREAEDAAQETFLRAYDQFGRYDPARPLKPWLLAIAHHHCIDRLRQRRGSCLDVDDEALVDTLAGQRPDDDPEVRALQNERNRGIQALLIRLAPEDRALVVMRYWYGLSYVEMAGATRSSVGAVKSRLHRARGVLESMLASNPWSGLEMGARMAKTARRTAKGALPGAGALTPSHKPAYAS
jgi:RNA polymerase sigma-70 factor (ECF subfamily)